MSQTPPSVFIRLKWNCTAMITRLCRCARHIFDSYPCRRCWVMSPWTCTVFQYLTNTYLYSLCRKLLLQFSTVWNETVQQWSLGYVDVQDTFLIHILAGIAELCPLELVLFCNIWQIHTYIVCVANSSFSFHPFEMKLHSNDH